ncbi:MAG: hypothetical protein HRU15_02645 [Planctomycetes bacterium]|nr:hypothetical protein [Planctomycetota bacterium]
MTTQKAKSQASSKKAASTKKKPAAQSAVKKSGQAKKAPGKKVATVKKVTSVKPKQTGKYSLLEAACIVLGQSKDPLQCTVMIERILNDKLWTTAGKTPAATLYSAILREMKVKGKDARFKKTGKGKFALQ